MRKIKSAKTLLLEAAKLALEAIEEDYKMSREDNCGLDCFPELEAKLREAIAAASSKGIIMVPLLVLILGWGALVSLLATAPVVHETKTVYVCKEARHVQVR